MRKFLFVSWESLSGDLAWEIKKEGHEVKAYIDDKRYKDVYDGFIEKTDDWEKEIDWADVIVFDDIGFGKKAEQLRKAGKLVVGGSVYADRLEEDREFGQCEMKRLGMNTLGRWSFTDYDEALKFIKKNPGRYVYKPSGFVPSDWKGLLFVGHEENGMDLYEVLESNKDIISKKIKEFQLQEYVNGVEVGASAFFNGKDFVTPISMGFEHKRLFAGELGPMTGEMGTLIYWCEPNRLFNETTAKLKDDLAKSGYVGYVDINCIVNGKGIYPLEFTCRFGYPFISIQMEGITSDWGEFLYALAAGEDFKLKAKRGFQVGVVCCVPPFPYDDPSEAAIYQGLSILFKENHNNTEGVHPGDGKMIDNVWRVTGDVGYALVVTGSGTTVTEARKQAHKRINNIILQNMFYRTDIGLKWHEDSDRLQAWGYI